VWKRKRGCKKKVPKEQRGKKNRGKAQPGNPKSNGHRGTTQKKLARVKATP